MRIDHEDENVSSLKSPQIGLARNAARSLIKTGNIIAPPILIKEIALLVPDLYIDGKELEDGISGMQVSYKGNFFIRYNSAHPVKRNRFTVAHEIGHLYLGHTGNCGRGEHNSRSIQEVEANQFAAELLMPLSILKKQAKTITTAGDLARAFWVSTDAMNRRLIETGVYKLLTSWS